MNPSSEHLCLISFRMDWLDLLAVQGTLKSLLQHHSLKVLILRRSASFVVQAQPSTPLQRPHCLRSALSTTADHDRHIPPLRARENG